MGKLAHPEFHRSLLDQAHYPSATRRIKFQETRNSYLYKTGVEVYKLRKDGAPYTNLAVKEALLHDVLERGKQWAPGIYLDLVPIVRTATGFALAAAGPPVDLALRMKQLPDRGWVDSLVHHQKLMPVSLSRLARFLAERHASLVGAATEQDSGRVEHFQALVEEVCTQVRRHIDLTLSQAMFDLATLSITRFMEGHRKLFMRRQKKSRVVHCHGAFSPEHVFVHGRTMLAISPLEGSRRFRVLDAANDVATFVNGLLLLEASELAELFTKRYAAAAKDRDLLEILPAYQLFQALRCGQSLSEWLAEGSLGEQARPDIQSKARRVLALAVELARRLLPQ